jgi:hypothetical protein
MQEPGDGTPQQQPRQNAEGGQPGEHRIGRRERAQAGEERAPATEHHGVRAYPVDPIAVVIAHFLIQMACGEDQAEEQADPDTACVERVGQRVAEQEVQRAAEQMIERRCDGRVLAEYRRARVQEAERGDRGAEQQCRHAEGGERGDREDEEDDRDPRDLAPGYALATEDVRRA